MENNDEHTNKIYPNWSALAKVQLPIKRFVTPSAEKSRTNEIPASKTFNEQNSSSSGTEIKQFYENTVKYFNKQPKHCEKSKIHITDNKTLSKVKIPFNQNQFFRAAMSNDINTLKSFDYNNSNNCINSTDMFGWSALMMAACENSIDSFKFLLENGAKLYITDNKGTLSSESIAKQKGFMKILDIIKNYKKSSFNLVSTTPTTQQKEKTNNIYENFYCNICNMDFQQTTIKNHETSTIHQFNIKIEHKNPLKYSFSKRNRGLKIMVKQGWDEESGLGPTGNGKLFPIKTVIRKQRSGLGVEQNSAKITHYKPYDLNAIKYKPLPKQKNRNDMKREKRRNQKQERRLRRELS